MAVKDRTNVYFAILLLFTIFMICAGQRISQFENRPVANKREKIIWCTISRAEQQKCTNFAMANERDKIKVGYQTVVIECKQAFNKDECMALLDEEKATMTTLDAGAMFIGGRYHSLIALAQEELEGGFRHYYSVAVIKKDTLGDVQSLYHLRGKKACFAGVETFAGWVLPINTLMKEGGMDVIDCNNHVKTATNYFGPSCAVNCLSDKYNPIGDNSDKLCQLCIGKIPGGRCTDSDPYAGYEGAFRCLLEAGDIAFLKHNTVQDIIAQMEFTGLTTDGFELLCKDGSRRPLKEYLSCNWGKVPSDAIVTSSAISFEDRDFFQRFLQKASERYGKKLGTNNTFGGTNQYGNNGNNQPQYDQYGNRIEQQFDQFGNPIGEQQQFDQYGNRINRYKRQNFGNSDDRNRDQYNQNDNDRNRDQFGLNNNDRDQYGQNNNNNRFGQDNNRFGNDEYGRNGNDPNRFNPDNNPYGQDGNRNDQDANRFGPDGNRFGQQDSNNPYNPDNNRFGQDDRRFNQDGQNNQNNDPFARDPYTINRDKYGVNIDPYSSDPTKYNKNDDPIYDPDQEDRDLANRNGTNGTFYETFSLFESVPKYGIHGNLLFQDSARRIMRVPENLQTYTNFLGESLNIIMGVRDCPVNRMTLCVTSDAEKNKCVKMRTALKAQLLKPEMDCHKAHSQIDCMKAIQGGIADVAVFDASDVYTAGLQYHLIPFISEVYNLEEPEYYVVAVGKESDPSTELTYLRGKNTCHGGINTAAGWVYPLAFLISNGWIRPYGCNSVRAAAEYFTKSCIPGALSTEYNTGVPYDNMCDLCHGPSFRYCRRDASEDYYGHTGAFRCLVEGGGHVAFVKHTTVTENTGGKKREWWARDNLNDDFELLCPDGTRAEINEYRKCNLGKVKTNAVVTREGHSNDEVNAFINLFMYAQTFYGRRTSDEFSFSMFLSEPPYSDLIFQDATTQLKVIEPSKRYFSEYLGKDFMRARRIVDCHAGSVSVTALSFSTLLTAVYLGRLLC